MTNLPHHRILKLDEALRGDRAPSLAELMVLLEVDRRTVFRRISELEELADCVVEWDRRHGGYRYASPPEVPVLVCLGLGACLETREWVEHAQCGHKTLYVRCSGGRMIPELLPFLVAEVVGQSAAVCGEGGSLRLLIVRLKNIQVLAAQPYRGDWGAAKQQVSADYLRRLERDELEQCLAA